METPGYKLEYLRIYARPLADIPVWDDPEHEMPTDVLVTGGGEAGCVGVTSTGDIAMPIPIGIIPPSVGRSAD